MNSKLRILTGVVFVVSSLTCALSAQQQPSGPEVIYDSYHDTSLPVRDYPDVFPQGAMQPRVQPRPRRIVPGAAVTGPDQAEQTYFATPVSATLSHNFDGIPDSGNGSVNGQPLRFVPSDSNLAVGSTQVVETINTAYQVYSKSTGSSLLGPRQISSIFTNFGGFCGQGSSGTYTDPIVLHDQIKDRWIISIVASDSFFMTGNECIAVSSTSDATGSYHRYVFSFGTDMFNDYPKLGVWPDAYYASYNIFSPTAFKGAKACAYQRSAMLAGTSAKAVCFTNASEFSFLPANLDGATPPPSGEPDFFLDLFSSTSLHLFRFHVDFTTTSNSKFSGPISIAVASFTPACNGGTCIPQASTGQKLDSLGDRLMFRLAYRNFGTHESLVVNHSVKTSAAAAGVRWYEIRSPNATPVVFQQSTFISGSNSLWMGSIAMDKLGDMALGFSESSSSIHPSIAYTGRVPTDPLNTMESLALIFAGTGSQTGGTQNGGNRWGDYTSMVIDPSDDCTFWYVNQYYGANKPFDFNFRTRLASLRFPACP
jgi:hypothetical protein